MSDDAPAPPDTDAAADRTLEAAVEIDATPGQVWEALTDPGALTRWFPLEAEVDPGEGGRIRMGWGEYFEGTARIEIWDPPRRLRTTWRMGAAGAEESAETEGSPATEGRADAEDTTAAEPTVGAPEGAGGPDSTPEDSPTPREQGSGRPAELVVDYSIETSSGSTLLRLVHSGFGRGSDWNDWFDGTRRGWDFQLCCLRHWLERHAQKERRVAWARKRTTTEISRAWDRLLGDAGLASEGALLGLEQGDDYRVVTVQGDELSGEVKIQDPPHQTALVVRELDDALLRIHGEATAGASEVELFLCTWGADPREVPALEERWQSLLDELLPEGGPREITSPS